ncbi:hypothetical protein [Thiomicrospira cyclica]|uniref:Uncharacterized protein n=1 Tax=Thiomicrospira cyclica (strain DSM 14477 / JCM 11371 / ALM1) TaxID=717773 RepID=F6DCI8_THICA|nr:hypothetical protein [Thiomicrospira cyclica]AEG31574.1 hypothetical protein Thicy_0802 [Thiomicrospira cyclica ALM1]
MLERFRYAKPGPLLHKLMSIVAWTAAIGWLYFTLINQAFIQRIFTGQTDLLDLILGLPLILSLAVVIYAMAYWATKLVVIVWKPHWLAFPDDHYDEYWPDPNAPEQDILPTEETDQPINKSVPSKNNNNEKK